MPVDGDACSWILISVSLAAEGISAQSGSWCRVSEVASLSASRQILGFGVALLDAVDPNPANFVGAGVIHTKNTQVGCLLRLEPNPQAQVQSHNNHTKCPA